jgi:hypothetical protein
MHGQQNIKIHSLNGTNRKLYIQGTVLLFVVISCVVALDLTSLYTEIQGYRKRWTGFETAIT